VSLLARNLIKYGKNVTFESRDMRVINGQASEVFVSIGADPDRAIICTVDGVTVFDGTNVERVVTHKVTLAYRADVTAEVWVRRAGTTKRLKILTVENCNESYTTLILMCTERGEDSKVVNQA
jgi:head-tail adaptor